MNWFWRDTARPAMFFGIEAYAVFPFLLFFLHMKWWTFWLATVSFVGLAALSRFGFTATVFIHFVRAYLAGRARFAVPWAEWLKRN